jgi:hypothetical protein
LINGRQSLAAATAELERFLERQAVVWVRGQHLNRDLALKTSAGGPQLIGRSD